MPVIPGKGTPSPDLERASRLVAPGGPASVKLKNLLGNRTGWRHGPYTAAPRPEVQPYPSFVCLFLFHFPFHPTGLRRDPENGREKKKGTKRQNASGPNQNPRRVDEPARGWRRKKKEEEEVHVARPRSPFSATPAKRKKKKFRAGRSLSGDAFTRFLSNA